MAAERVIGMAHGTRGSANSMLVALGERLRAARARARIPDQAEWAAPRRRSVGRRGIARDDLVAYVAYRSGLELDGSTVARWESGQHRPRPAHIRAVVAALADLDAFAGPADAEAILQLAQADTGTVHGRLDLSQLTTVSGARRTQPTIGVLLALEQGVVEASYVLAAPTTVLGRGRDVPKYPLPSWRWVAGTPPLTGGRTTPGSCAISAAAPAPGSMVRCCSSPRACSPVISFAWATPPASGSSCGRGPPPRHPRSERRKTDGA